VGFKFRNDWNESIDDKSKRIFSNFNLPPWLLLAGEHGEFELLFSIPAERKIDFLKEAHLSNLKPICLATAIEDVNIKLNLYDNKQILDTEKIRNLAFEKEFSPQKYLQKLLNIDTSLKSYL
jgi:thiamine-monophosphate kinase